MNSLLELCSPIIGLIVVQELLQPLILAFKFSFLQQAVIVANLQFVRMKLPREVVVVVMVN